MKRYVVLHKVNGKYGRECETDSLVEAYDFFDEVYYNLDEHLEAMPENAVGSVTLFDRVADVDIKHVELIRYRQGV